MVLRHAPPCLGHDRRDAVHELRQAGNSYPIGVIQKGNAGAAEGERVLHCIDFLKDGGATSQRSTAGVASLRVRYQTFHSSKLSIRRLFWSAAWPHPHQLGRRPHQ